MRLAALLVAAGCATPAAPPVRPVVANAGMDDGGYAVRVLDPGHEPRRALRYDLHLAQFASVELLTRSTTDLVMLDPVAGKVVNRSDVPTIREILGIEVTAKLPDGSVRIAWRLDATSVLDDVPIDPKVRANLEATMASLVGMHGSARLNPRGVVSESSFDLPPGASEGVVKLLEAMRETLAKLYVPLPVDPVGLGATWEVSSTLPLFGATASTTARDHLVALDGNAARWDTTITLGAHDQAIAMNGLSGTLHSMTGVGHGEVVWAPTQLMPLGHVAMTTDGAFSIGSAGHVLEATMRATVTLASRATPRGR